MDIELSGLLIFRHLAKTGSFTETGKRWKMSQPAVSLMISKLESSVGLVLFERSTAGTKLTPAGMQFLERANEVCDSYLTFIDGIHQLGRRMDHEILIAMDRSAFSECLAREILKNPQASGGNLRLASDAGPDWSESLKSGQFDVVLASRFLQAGISPELQEAVIHCERGLTVAWNPAFHQFNPEKFNFPEVLRTTILIPDGTVVAGFSSFLEMWFNYAYGMQPAHTITFTSEKEAAAAASAGLGIMLAPGDGMPRLGQEGENLMHVRTFEFLLPEAFCYGVYCRSDEHSKDVMQAAAAIGKLGRKLSAGNWAGMKP